jgi:ABC-type methionine transport system ATPase subunit
VTNSPPAFRLRRVRQVKAGITALDDVSVDIPQGQITALIGPSGAGKSALLRLLNRLDDPTTGEIYYRGQPIVDIPVRTLRRRVGFVFQTPVAFPGTVRDNLSLAASIAEVPADEIDGRISGSARLADIDGELLDRPADRLSGGQLQRVNIARALMTGPETLLMDEPTASLDPETAETIGHTIACLSSQHGLTVVMASHRIAEAKALAGYAVMLDKGAVVEAGPASDLFQSSHPRLRAFLSRVG